MGFCIHSQSWVKKVVHLFCLPQFVHTGPITRDIGDYFITKGDTLCTGEGHDDGQAGVAP